MSDVSYCTVGLMDRDLEAALDTIAAAGFTHAELLGTSPHLETPPTGRRLSEFRDRLASRGLAAAGIHAPCRLSASEEYERHKSAAVLAGYIRCAGAIGAKEVVVHPVPDYRTMPNLNDPALPGRLRDGAKRSLDELIPVAREAGVRILLENLGYPCDLPLLNMKALRPFTDAYPPEYVGLVIDTGHAWISKNDPAAEIRIAGSRLWGTHLQDSAYDDANDKHWMPTHGVLDWDAIRGALTEVTYAGTWTFEVINGRHGESPDDLACMTRRVAETWGL